MAFTKATKKQAKGRVAFVGVTGSGKTWTSLMWAKVLAGPNGRVALIDTENASASKYADTYEFDTMVLTSFQPKAYIAAIHEAEAAGYDVLVIDSLSHAWSGKDGVLAMVDNATSRARSGNAFTTGWREVTPEHNALVDALVQCKCHLIVTMRAKTEYVIEDVNGKKIPRKIGMAPVQRDGMEYEFDLVADMDANHQLLVTKSRCRPLDKFVALEPGPDVAEKFSKWLTEGEATAPNIVPGADMTVEEALQYGERIDQAFKSRGFDVPDAEAAIAKVLGKFKLPNHKAGGKAWCEKFVKNIEAGMYDKMKPVAAESVA